MRIHVDAVQKIAKAHHLEEATENAETFIRFLEWWWCRTFNRPMKDPLLKTYTPDELLYEFLRHFYLNPEHDPRTKMEEAKKALDEEEWIKSMLAQTPPTPPKAPPKKKRKARKKTKKLPDLPEIKTQFEE